MRVCMILYYKQTGSLLMTVTSVHVDTTKTIEWFAQKSTKMQRHPG